jgi:hypothetical protein
VRDKDGKSLGTERAHLEAAAKQGSTSAIADLTGPPFPEPLSYLYDWLHELHGRSGVGMHSVNVLTYTTIRDWATLTHRDVSAREVSALIVLDSVLCHPSESSDG